MEQQNKYYTPSIEELHVGYCNYEVCYKEGIWTDMLPIVDGIQIDNIADLLSGRVGYNVGTHVRTKYLDREDIESCGWEHTGVDHGKQYYQIIKDTEKLVKATYTLTKRPEQIIIRVKFLFNRNTLTLYSGECPSINELRKIMQLVGIM